MPITDDSFFHIDNYDLVRADHLNDVKRGGVCVYVKSSLSARTCNINRLNECLVLEVSFDNKKGYIVCLYRSPSQSNDEFDDFLINLSTCLGKLPLEAVK